MPLSAPIHVLKQRAKLAARNNDTPLHTALDHLAAQEGFQSWSHLAAHTTRPDPAETLAAALGPGDLCLIGARPGQGKTLLGLALALRAKQLGRQGYFFTLDYTAKDVAQRHAFMGAQTPMASVIVDTSDEISAPYIVARLSQEIQPVLAVIDYLQLLDQRRSTPCLADQIIVLRDYVRRSGAICAVISQIDRSFDISGKDMPEIPDIRLPNPVDLTTFSTFCFLHEGRVQIC